MNQDSQEALYEIMDMAPMYRREYIMSYIRQNLPWEEAKLLFIEKSKELYINRMLEQGYTSIPEILAIIGAERVKKFLYTI